MIPATNDPVKKIIYIDNQILSELRSCEVMCAYWLRGLRYNPQSCATYFGSKFHQCAHKLYGFWLPDGSYSKKWDVTAAIEESFSYDPQYEDDRGRTQLRLQGVIADYAVYQDSELDYQRFGMETDTLLAEEFVQNTIGYWSELTTDFYLGSVFQEDHTLIPGMWEVKYCGVIDRVLFQESTNTIYIIDHKTTSFNAITAEMYELTPQFCGYVWLVSNAFPGIVAGKEVKFIIDLIKLQSKKENKFYRKVLPYEEEGTLGSYWKWRCDEWLLRRRKEIQRLLNLQAPFVDSPNCSAFFKSCDYYPLCKEPPGVREAIAETLYHKDHWSMHGNSIITEGA